MSEENLAVVRERFEAWRRGDFDAAHASDHPDIELVPDPAWPEAGPHRGGAAVRTFYERYRDSWSTAEDLAWELLDAGDRVVARFSNRVRGSGSGMELETRATSVFTLCGGRITRIEFFFDHDEALRAAGLDPQ